MIRVSVLLLGAAILAPISASAAVIGRANVSLSSAVTFTFADASFTFAYDPVAAAAFDPATYAVSTQGSAQTSAFGGFLGIPLTPSLFDQSGVTIDAGLFPSYAAFPLLTAIPYSLVAGDLALRTGAGADAHYGYARLNGDGTLDFGIESVANTAITAGAAITGPLPTVAVPEPSSITMAAGALAALGLLGAGVRRRAPRL